MVYAFDTLGYAKRLRDAGVTLSEAEAHAEAARDFVMAELVTRTDLDTSTNALRRDLEASIAALRSDLEASIAALRSDMEASIAALRRDMDASFTSVREEMAGMRRDFQSALDNMGLRLTVRLGAMMGVAIAVLAAIIKL
jgi:DNA-binding transcriptional MerR regulator